MTLFGRECHLYRKASQVVGSDRKEEAGIEVNGQA